MPTNSSKVKITSNRRDELDGLKGVACFVVFIYHMLLSLFCFSQDQDNVILDVLVNTIFNGYFMVFVFATISGWLAYTGLPNSFMGTVRKSFKRYFKFALLFLISNFLIFAMSRTIGFHSAEIGECIHNTWLSGYYNSPMTITGAIVQAVTIRSLFNGPLWVMPALILAPSMIYFFSWIYDLKVGLLEKHIIIGIIATASLIAVYILPFSEGVPFAMIASYIGALMHKYEDTVNKIMRMYNIPIIGGGICIYIIAIVVGMGKFQDLLMIIPASIVTCEVLYVKQIKRFFSCKIFIKASSISLAIYVLHWPLFCSLGLWLLILMGFSSYGIHSMLVIAITTVVVVISSWVFHNTIERVVSFFVKKI